MMPPNQKSPDDLRTNLCIFCPVYNEQTVIPLFLDRMRPVIAEIEQTCDVRLIFLNNASKDLTLDVIMRQREAWPIIDVLSMSRNVGYQSSLDMGLRSVEADLYAFIDVDCEDPPEMLPQLLAEHRQGNDIVYGQRTDRDEAWAVKSIRKVFYRLLQRVADDDIILDMAEFSLFTREVRDAIIVENSSFPFVRAAIARVGFRRKGLSYRRHRRIGGQTHYNLIGMTIFAIAGILSASTLLLRLPIYLFPFWLLAITGLAVQFASTQTPGVAAAGFVLTAAYLGFTSAVTALYVARSYKNGLSRPNAVLDARLSTIARAERPQARERV